MFDENTIFYLIFPAQFDIIYCFKMESFNKQVSKDGELRSKFNPK